MDIVELNERCRFLLYVPGQKFAPHSDGCYIRPHGIDEKGDKLKNYGTLHFLIDCHHVK